jgi:hypothetical protein
MENKYYTPVISEFHIGFKFEYKDSQYEDSEWGVQTCTAISLRDAIWCEDEDKKLFGKNYRVRYLSNEDIESLGFEYDLNTNIFECRTLGVCYRKEKVNIYYFYNELLIKVLENEEVLFNGRINNKNEFIKLLIQLEI